MGSIVVKIATGIGAIDTAINNPGSTMNNINTGAQVAAAGSVFAGFLGGPVSGFLQTEAGGVAAATATGQLFNDIGNGADRLTLV